MSERSDAPRAASAPGPALLLLARGVPAVLVGLVTTFTGGHSALFGLVSVAAWGVVGGLAEGALIARMSLPARVRTFELLRSALVLVVGVASAALAAVASPQALVYLVGLGALLWGAADLAAGVTARRASGGAPTPLGREWLLHGGITVLMGVLALIVPPGFVQPFPGAGDPGVLTASTVVVGFFGAWGIVIGVLSLIAAVGQRTTSAARS